MFNHRLLAVDGLYPGLTSPFSVASFGVYEIEIIITPAPVDIYQSKGGGGTVAGNIAYAPYRVNNKVLIKIKFGDKEWEEEYEDTSNIDFLKDSKEIIVNFIKQKEVSARAEFIGNKINTHNTIIKVTKL